MLKVGWTQRRINVRILKTVEGGRELIAVVRRLQIAFLGHIMRTNGLENVEVTRTTPHIFPNFMFLSFSPRIFSMLFFCIVKWNL